MKTKDLLALTRRMLRDTVVPYLWSDESLLDYLTEGQEKAARNARLIRDFTTPAICRLSVVTTRQWYALDRRVIFVRRVILGDRTTPLEKISYRDLDRQQPGWIDRTGTPNLWCGDFETGKLWFNRKPTAAATAKLFVVRLPLEPLVITKLDVELELPDTYCRPIHHWALHRAFSEDDEEKRDPVKAAAALGAFRNEFGDDSTAIDEEWERQKYGEQDMEGEL